MSDGRASLWLEYYLGRSESPVYDDDGNHVVYESGAMKGKLKYRVQHLRKKEALNLYVWVHPRSAQERQQNKNTLALAEKIRFEKEQEMLEDRKGYRLKREKESNFLRYFRQHREVQRAFIFCCFTGLRYCDVSELTFANVDYESMVMRFNQKKSAGRSAHAAVVTPLNEELIKLIGHPKEDDNPKEKIFDLPHKGTARKHLARWVKNAGIRKSITWHTAQDTVSPSIC
mgnify:CR=1 FL=1